MNYLYASGLQWATHVFCIGLDDGQDAQSLSQKNKNAN